MFNAKVHSIDECNFDNDNDKFNVTDELCLTSSDVIVSNVLETGFSATEIVVLSTHKQAFGHQAEQWIATEQNKDLTTMSIGRGSPYADNILDVSVEQHSSYEDFLPVFIFSSNIFVFFSICTEVFSFSF